MKQASECGRSKQNTCSFIRTPPMTPSHEVFVPLAAIQGSLFRSCGAFAERTLFTSGAVSWNFCALYPFV